MSWRRFIRRRWWDQERAREIEAYLPGVPPTGRKVVLPNVVVMGFDDASGKFSPC